MIEAWHAGASSTGRRHYSEAKRGVIRGYHADIDLKALNRGVQALIAVQVRPMRRSVIDAFKDSVGQLPP